MLIGEEVERPYERPPLSKGFLLGKQDSCCWPPARPRDGWISPCRSGRSALPLQAALGPGAGACVTGGSFAQVHRQHGVDVRLGTAVSGFRGTGHVAAVLPDDGEQVPADVVIVGVGGRPNTTLTAEAGLVVNNGVLVDAALCTGDGSAAARSMLGQQVSYDRAPYFFTDQYDVGMESTGWFVPGGYDALITRGDLPARAFHAFWLTDDRIVA